MSNIVGPTRAYELLNSLKGIVHDFAAIEGKLNHELRVKLTAERQRHEWALSEAARVLEERSLAAKEIYHSDIAAAKARYERRKLRISIGYKTSQRRAYERIDDEEGRAKYKFQAEALQSGRDRDNGLAATEVAITDFRNVLAQDQQVLGTYEEAARDSFKRYGNCLRILANSRDTTGLDLTRDEHQLLAELHDLLNKTGEDISRFRHAILTGLFRWVPFWVVVVAAQVPLVMLLQKMGNNSIPLQYAKISTGACFGLGIVLYLLARGRSEPVAVRIANALEKSRKLHHACHEKSELSYKRELERIEHEFQTRTLNNNKQWDEAVERASQSRTKSQDDVDHQERRLSGKVEQRHRLKLEKLDANFIATTERLKAEAEAKRAEATRDLAQREGTLNASVQTHLQNLSIEWKGKTQPIYDAFNATRKTADELFPEWSTLTPEKWQPPTQFAHLAKVAEVDVNVETLSEGAPKDKLLALPGPARFNLPLLLNFPNEGSVLFETKDTGRDKVMAAFNNVIMRVLSVAPPGRVSFTVIDPVGLGENFAGVMHLADYAEHLINNRIWTQSGQIEEKLTELNEHMEKVIQMYLRNEYKSIVEYNEQAGNIAEKYHFLVVADFPANFTDAAAKRLFSIATTGARCGVYTLIHWDQRQPLPTDFMIEDLRKSGLYISCKDRDFLVGGKFIPGTRPALDPAPTPEFAIDFIHKVGIISRDSNRVEVPFSHITPKPEEYWSIDNTNELRVPIGRTGATKLQYLAIGKGTRQHALIAGKTGSGKSTLFHVIICNLSLWCSPEQVEFYLIDFKKGVEFKCYATKKLPHARVVAIESDREFGLSVLQRVDEELKRRGDLFRKLGVQDIAGYKRAGGTESIPRSLLMIDEFQEFFVEDDKISQGASLLLDRIVRQGRAFGIHVILGSQTLGGAYSMARATLGQMVIRIALQCNEADAYLIMDENNAAPRLLSRPGEGIYNDSAGALEGNSPFQAVWLSDEVRDGYLDKVNERAQQTGMRYAGPIVFEGDAPADVWENPLLRGLLAAPSVERAVGGRIWLGAPNSIKGPTEVAFHRQSGNNLLVVGQRDEAILAMLAASLVALAAQYPKNTARFIVVDATPPGTTERDYLERVIKAIPHPITMARNNDLADVLQELATDMKRRADGEADENAPEVFLFIHGLQKFGRLRYEDDFSFSSSDSDAPAKPSAVLNNLICEGTGHGFHVIAMCDSFNNVNRYLSRKAVSEFEFRVLFQMSANDSASLIESPKAGSLGLHRAVLFNSQEGHLEVFRPYAIPGNDWIEHVAKELARLLNR